MWSPNDVAGGLLLAALAVVTALVVIGSAKAATPPVTIYAVNDSSLVTDQQLADALPAFQQALDQDLAPAWNVDATLVQIPSGQTAPAGSWTITISDESDQFDAAGYHKICPGDTPCAFVFADAGLNWQLVFSHELFEMLVDPHTERVAAGPKLSSSVIYELEVADPVEDIRWSYTIPGADGTPVVISDFVTERWFDCQGGGAMDFTGHLRRAHQLLAGGYALVFKNGGWTQLTA